jgi:hypothetical protein
MYFALHVGRRTVPAATQQPRDFAYRLAGALIGYAVDHDDGYAIAHAPPPLCIGRPGRGNGTFIEVVVLRRTVCARAGAGQRSGLPRVAQAFEGFDELPVFPGICYLAMTTAIRPFARQSVRQSFERIVLAAEEGDRFARQVGEFIRRMYSHGYPMINLSSLFFRPTISSPTTSAAPRA